jgi:type VI protein secretion system component Hcp
VKVRLRTLVAGAATVAIATAGLVGSSGTPSASPQERRITTLKDAQLAADTFVDGFDRYLSVSGFAGGTSTTGAHPNLVPVDNIRIGLSVAATTATTGATTAGKARLEPVVITKNLDAYSPQFSRAAALGTHLGNVTVYVYRSATNTPYDIAVFSLTNVLVTHDVIDARGNEQLTLLPIAECVTYNLQNDLGTLQPYKTCFNTATNKVS